MRFWGRYQWTLEHVEAVEDCLQMSLEHLKSTLKEHFMTKKINMTDKYQTRDGRPVRVLAVDASGQQPVIALIGGDMHESVARFDADGAYIPGRHNSSYDLVKVPVEHVQYLNVYPDGGLSSGYSSRAAADSGASSNRNGCIRVTFKDGQFDA